MNDKDIIETINDIVWWIPFRKLRDFIRELVYTILEIKELLHFIKELNNNIDGNRQYIVVQMSGGFTDQLHHYRLGYSIEKLYNKKVLYDIQWYNYHGKDAFGKYNRNLDIFNIFDDIHFETATDNEIQIAKNYFTLIDYKNTDITNIVKYNKIIYLHSLNLISLNWGMLKTNLININKVFDLDKYILPKLENDNKSVYDDIKNCKHSVACHVRRNDYISVEHRIYSFLDENYFIKAIEKVNEKIKERLKIYFFSDDMDWVKNKLIPLIKNKYDYMTVDINDNDRGYFDFYLISNCKYQIASEGGFCRTAYQFNKYKNKILITPNDIDKKYIRNK